MIYQVRTFYPLSCSKKYCETVDILQAHIADVIKATNLQRKSMDPEEVADLKWDHPVTVREIEDGLEVISIDDTELPDWHKYFGDEAPITPTLMYIRDGKKIFPRMRTKSCEVV